MNYCLQVADFEICLLRSFGFNTLPLATPYHRRIAGCVTIGKYPCIDSFCLNFAIRHSELDSEFVVIIDLFHGYWIKQFPEQRTKGSP
jgi:hypothetical protein